MMLHHPNQHQGGTADHFNLLEQASSGGHQHQGYYHHNRNMEWDSAQFYHTELRYQHQQPIHQNDFRHHRESTTRGNKEVTLASHRENER